MKEKLELLINQCEEKLKTLIKTDKAKHYFWTGRQKGLEAALIVFEKHWNTRAEPKQEEYKKYEFCKAVNCHKFHESCLINPIDCNNFDHGCPKSAYELFYWLKNNYKIIKSGE
ncbi:MAG: hypothetical protein KAS32_10040 [Candidatus Peribacteraceae bacterium]|nr:hypothetical protein [Candidatus Peribacteraceae bacterium]